jgi:hypothetical protein
MMSDGRANNFLRMIRRSHRGRLKIYLGFAPGVGKTFQMLSEGHRLRAEGVDVVIGVVEHHERAATKALIDGLERVPMRTGEYHGIRGGRRCAWSTNSRTRTCREAPTTSAIKTFRIFSRPACT